MARIAGTEFGIAAPLQAQLARFPGETHEVASAAVRFRWMGRGAAELASKHDAIAVVDGRFYNREELGVADAPIAEQLIELHRRHGFAQALAKINGDFAVALYDGRNQTLYLGRDRVGHRPLYYVQTGDGLAFCSQPGPLRVLPGVAAGINRRWVAVFAGSHYRYIDNRPEESPFEGVNQLPAASMLECAQGKCRTSAYWTLREQPEFTDDEATLAAQYRELLLDAVRRRLAATDSQIFTLSGGMDSSSVLASAAHLTGRKQIAVSTVYSDRTYDESEDIKGFVAEKVERWLPVPVNEFDLFGTVRRMVRAHDEPVATATWLSHFLLCDRVKNEKFGTLFGGLGGDELNAGEYEYFIFHFADILATGDQQRLAHEIAEWARHHDHPIYRKNREAAERLVAKLTDQTMPGRVRVERERLGRYAGAVRRDYFDLAGFEPIHDHPFSGWLKNRTFQDIFRETAPCCLRAEDRNCGAFGLDHVDPFFDHRLMEFMFRVPGHMKIRDGVTKRLLRAAMAGIVPEETRMRVKKTGWNAPAHLWFSGNGITQLQDMASSRAFRERGVYDVAQVQRLITEHCEVVESRAVKENHMMFIWQLVNLELWFQEVVDA